MRPACATRRPASPSPPLAEALAVLAARVAALAPCRRDPERFHCEKSDLVHALRRLATEAGARR